MRPAARVLPVALVLGWGADRLFYGQWPGLAVPLFVALLLGALALLARLEGAPLARRNLWIVPPLLFFALMIAVRANEFLTALNFMAVALLLALVASFALAGRLHHLGVMGYPLVTLQVLLEAALRPAPALGAVVREGWGRGRGSPRCGRGAGRGESSRLAGRGGHGGGESRRPCAWRCPCCGGWSSPCRCCCSSPPSWPRRTASSPTTWSASSTSGPRTACRTSPRPCGT